MTTPIGTAESGPATPTNIPYIGRSKKARNLWLNAGHGTLGWTHGAGSGKALAELISSDGKAKVAIVARNDDYGKGFSESLQAALEELAPATVVVAFSRAAVIAPTFAATGELIVAVTTHNQIRATTTLHNVVTCASKQGLIHTACAAINAVCCCRTD
mgnify:CR=1 FL=1